MAVLESTTDGSPATLTPVAIRRIKFEIIFSYFAFIIIIGAPLNEAAIIQAVIEIDDSPENFIKIIMEKLDHLIDYKRNLTNQTQAHSNGDKTTHFHVASSTLMNLGSAAAIVNTGKRFIIRGNITDNTTDRKSSVVFKFYAEAINRTTASSSETNIRLPLSICGKEVGGNDNLDEACCDEDSDYQHGRCYTNGGILDPIVKTIEPYLVTMANIVFHGIMTSVISKIMESANMMGDVRVA